MNDGTIMDYIKKYPDVDIVPLVKALISSLLVDNSDVPPVGSGRRIWTRIPSWYVCCSRRYEKRMVNLSLRREVITNSHLHRLIS